MCSSRQGGKVMALDLSVIVIARNEEAHIGASLEACLRATDLAQRENLVHESEVILVDSASDDQTVEIARNYPVAIIHLPGDWPLSAAAGRYIGARHASGGMLLFVDGDFVLTPEWLPAAIHALLKDETVAAVCGPEIEELTGNSTLMRHLKAHIESLRGEPTAINVGLYRRQALETAGGIHPFLKGAEDRDVAYRLRARGYRLTRIGQTMGTHYWSDKRSMDFLTYFRSVLIWSVGDGQLYRLHRRQHMAGRDIRRRYFNARYAYDYLLGLGLVLLILVNLTMFLGVGLSITAIVDVGAILLILAAKYSRRQTWNEFLFGLHVVPYALIRLGGFLYGYSRQPPDPSGYPSGEQVEITPVSDRRG